MKLFAFGTKKSLEQGLLLVDTKYEFGVVRDASGARQLVLADEVHTQDSSRYWIAKSYQERFQAARDPEMLDKEFVRRHLMEEFNYMGDGETPTLSDDFRVATALKYVDVYQRITGEEFKAETGSIASEISRAIESYDFG